MARCFADAFRAEGLEVWWDNALQAGEVFDEAIEQALRAAKAVVVLWSPDSVASRWVRAEATLADRNKTLVPALIAPCQRPIIFELTQTADLAHWKGEATDKVWQGFVADVRRLAGLVAPAQATPTAQMPSLDQVSIVVLPFANMSRDEDQEYFADGISEDVITDLSKVSALGVVARNTAFTFKGRSLDIKDVAQQLNVTHVLEGSVRKSGNRVRITAQLIDGSSGNHLWAERYDRDLDDIFELQDEISQAIVKALKIKLLPAETDAIGRRGTADPEAYDLFMRARALQGQLTIDSVKRGERLLRDVLVRDPSFLDAQLLLYSLLGYSRLWWPERAGAINTEMDRISQHAVAVAPHDPAALTVRAMSFVESKAFREAEIAFARVPHDQRFGNSTLTEAGFRVIVGRMEEALPQIREAVGKNPLDRLTCWFYRDTLDATGRIDEAELEDERSKDLPGDRGFIELCGLFRLKGRAPPERIEAQYQTFLGVRMSDMCIPLFESLADCLFDAEAGKALVREALSDPYFDMPSRMIWLSGIACWFDAVDEAIEALGRALGGPRGSFMLTRYIWMPILSPARRDPRCKPLFRSMGLVDYWRTTGQWGDFARPMGDDDFEIVA